DQEGAKAEGSDGAGEAAEPSEEKPKKSTRTRTRQKKSVAASPAMPDKGDVETSTDTSETPAPAKKKRKPPARTKKAAATGAKEVERPKKPSADATDVEEASSMQPILVGDASQDASIVDAPAIAAAEEPASPDKPRRRGWWSVGRR
ncbi:MAG: hypothetical protein ACR2OY_08860, partial [Boseongicola sp.]